MSCHRLLLSAITLTAALAPVAHAEVQAVAPDGFTLRFEAAAPQAREDIWGRLMDLSAWWSSAHTYSGDAANLSLEAEVGGCWCERWDGGAVAHGRVVALQSNDMIRFDAAFGPLQAMGANAVLTVTLSDAEDDAGVTVVAFDYAVSGSSVSALDAIAPAVDRVLGEQFARLIAP